jgi:membrane protein
MFVQVRRLRLQQAAASLAFLSLLAAVPVLSISLAVLAALPIFERLRDDLQSFLYRNLFPEAFNQIVIERLNEFAARATSLSSISAIAFFLTAIAALRVIERTMNMIWRARSRRSFAGRLGLYWVLLTLGPLLLAGSVALSTDLIDSALLEIDAPALRSAWLDMVPWLTGGAVVWLLFMTLPATRVNPVHALAGALLSVALIAALQRSLTAYVKQLPTYEVVYGTFAALPLVLIWLFALWIAFLLGAVVAANLRHWREPRRQGVDNVPGQIFADARFALDAMLSVTGGRVDAALPAAQLRAWLADDSDRLDSIGILLEETGYIVRFLPLAELNGFSRPGGAQRLGRGTADLWLERWAWRSDPGQLTLRRLFDRIWWSSEVNPMPVPRAHVPSGLLDQPLVLGLVSGQTDGANER